MLRIHQNDKKRYIKANLREELKKSERLSRMKEGEMNYLLLYKAKFWVFASVNC